MTLVQRLLRWKVRRNLAWRMTNEIEVIRLMTSKHAKFARLLPYIDEIIAERKANGDD